jgi:hypothetical protein
MGKKRNAYGVLVWQSEGERTLEKPRRRWVFTVKMDFKGMGWGHGMDSSGSG